MSVNSQSKPSRPTQETPADLVERLCQLIRSQFCGDASQKEWYRDHYHFIKRYVVMWPAKFITSHNFILPPARYEAIMLGILQDIKRHGQTGAVRYWPGYLMKCVQEHWRHNWETYYQEAKSARALTERALLACKPTQAEDKTVEAIALAHSVLTHKSKVARRVAAPRQLGLRLDETV